MLKNILFSVLCTCTFSIFANPPALLPERALAKILLEQDIVGSLIEVKGSCKIYDMESKKSLGVTSHGRFWFTSEGNSLRWGNREFQAQKVAFVPQTSSTTILIDGRQYQGAVAIYNLDGKLSVVNQLPLEDFLHSLISSKIESSLSKPALDAFVIVLRTNLIHIMQKYRKNLWHFERKKMGYEGFAAIRFNKDIVQALHDTKSLILQPQENKATLGLPTVVYWNEENSQFSIPFAKDRARYHWSAKQILKKAYPQCVIEKFDHRLAPPEQITEDTIETDS